MKTQDKKELELIVQKISRAVSTEEIYLFGSFAQKTDKADSDFDIYVVLNKSEIRPLKAIQKINMALCDSSIRSVDILANYHDIFINESKNLTIEKTVMEEGIKIYEGNRFISQALA